MTKEDLPEGMTPKKKLIEVALPLEAINKASAREKSIRHGHPSTLHLWWAQRPLAAARAVIFAQMVDDPSSHPDLFPTERKQEKERQRLLKIIENLVLWENTTNETVLQRARDEIWQSWRYTCAGESKEIEKRREEIEDGEYARLMGLFDPDQLPAFHDPFAGGGALPLEAQRLGLESYASDLNPVAVLINKAMIEIPPRFAGQPPVHPDAGSESGGVRSDSRPSRSSLLFPLSYKGAQGLAEDVRYYGQWMRDEAERRIGHLYPKVTAWRDGPSGRYFGEADVEEWRRSEERGVTSEYGEQVARQCDHPSLSSLLTTLSSHQLTVIAWLWARTVKSPNPAFANVDVPLASTFMLSTKAGKEAWVEPVIWREVRNEERVVRAGIGGDASHSSLLSTHSSPGYRFTVHCRSGCSPTGRPEGRPTDAERMATAKNGTKLARANFACLMSGTPVSGDYIKAEGKAGRMGARLMAIVAEGERGRVYLAPTPEMEAIALTAQPTWKPEGEIPKRMTGGNCTPYGLTTWGDLFTPRQLVALTTFSDLVQEARERVKCDALAASLSDDAKTLEQGGAGTVAYADALVVYLGFSGSRMADRHSSLRRWDPNPSGYAPKIANTFGRQALPMVSDYVEGNPFSPSSGNLLDAVGWVAKVVETSLSANTVGAATQLDATEQEVSGAKLVSTDPPYYDNIGYADLSDFVYVWLRRSLRPVFPVLFATLAVPKAEELVATPYRHGSKEKAEAFFLVGMTQAMHRLAERAHPAFPVTIYYAFKQAETKGDGDTTNTGWDTFLAAVIEAGFAISGTWPMRTELGNRMIGSGTNALASSIILVCRKRPLEAPTATRREFVAALKAELPVALRLLQGLPEKGLSPHSSFLFSRTGIAPVDLAQAAIGPGMAVYTRYAKVLDAEGKPLPVRAALALINQTLDEALAEQEGDFDADSRWALTWFEQTGFAEGDYGIAEQLSKSKNTSVSGLAEAGILVSKAGKVRLLKPAELPADWDPEDEKRGKRSEKREGSSLTSHSSRLTPHWMMVHQLIRVLESGGEGAAAALVAKLGSGAETARESCYRLYVLSDRKKRATEAMAYNALVQSWPEITRLARETPGAAVPGTGDLFDQT
jgi:putative DNA methylase